MRAGMARIRFLQPFSMRDDRDFFAEEDQILGGPLAIPGETAVGLPAFTQASEIPIINNGSGSVVTLIGEFRNTLTFQRTGEINSITTGSLIPDELELFPDDNDTPDFFQPEYFVSRADISLSSLDDAILSGDSLLVWNAITKGDNLITGSSGGDDLIAGRGDDRIKGGGGADSLRGGKGDDTVAGGRGADQLDGGEGSDVVKGQGGRDVMNGAGGNDNMNGGAGDDRANGGAGNDLIRGKAGDDTLFGQGGDDTLIGGNGDDFLRGGQGEDVFRFGRNDGDNVIADFRDGQDLLDFDFSTASDPTRFLDIRNDGNDVLISAVFGDTTVTIRNASASEFSDVDFV